MRSGDVALARLDSAHHQTVVTGGRFAREHHAHALVTRNSRRSSRVGSPRAHRTGSARLPSVPVTVREDRSQSILTENVVGDVDYRWTLNPYRGCEHACTACYARGSHEYLDLDPGDDFDRIIVAKRDAAALLREAFERDAWRGATITFSSITDPYQPVEKELEITRQCLEVCLEYRNPVRIVTKSPLAARDLDLFVALHAEARCRVDVSVALTDAALCRSVEPGAPSPDERFELMAQIARAGVPVGVMAAPIIPGLGDEQLPGVLERAAAAGATSACWALLRLPEPTATVFADRLRRDVPAAAERVLNRARASRGHSDPADRPFHDRGSGGGAPAAAIAAMFDVTTRRLGLVARPFSKAAEAGLPPTTFRRPPKAQLDLLARP